MIYFTYQALIESASAVIGTNAELGERNTLVGCIGLYVLYRRLVPANVPPDAKLYRVLWGLQKSIPMVILSENVMWLPSEFIAKHTTPFDVKKLEPPNADIFRRQYLTAFDSSLGARTHSIVSQCKAWMILAEGRLQNSLRNESNTSSVLDLYGSIVLKGLSLVSRASYLAKSCLVMHERMQVPMPRSCLTDITLLVECLKAMEYTFLRKDAVISENMVHIHRYLASAVCILLEPLKLRMEAVRKMDVNQAVIHAAVCCIENILKGSDTLSSCRLVSNVCVSVC